MLEFICHQARLVHGCFIYVLQVVTAAPPTAPPQVGCDDNEFECDTGGCIPENQRCDGIPQCQDRSDEDGCGKL